MECKAAHIELRFMTAVRATLAGDFGASITPARSGRAGPFLVSLNRASETRARSSCCSPSCFSSPCAGDSGLVAMRLPARRLRIEGARRRRRPVRGVRDGVGVLAVVLAGTWTTRPGGRSVFGSAAGGGQRSTAGSPKCVRQSIRWHIEFQWAVGAYLMSVMHVACGSASFRARPRRRRGRAPRRALWPLGLLYGAAIRHPDPAAPWSWLSGPRWRTSSAHGTSRRPLSGGVFILSTSTSFSARSSPARPCVRYEGSGNEPVRNRLTSPRPWPD